jgi:hypothetical protein
MLPSIPGLLVEISYYYLLALQPGVGPWFQKNIFFRGGATYKKFKLPAA